MSCLFAIIFSMSSWSAPKQVDLKDFKWAQSLKEQNFISANVCGDSEIQLTKRALRKHFLLGETGTGYLLTGLIRHEEYWKVLRTKNLEEAKRELMSYFHKTVLWVATKDGVKSLGQPKEVRMPFTATVKDCMEGAKTTLGSSCSHVSQGHLSGCCSEKFPGPKILWEDGTELWYSPDPSVRLKVKNERKHRFCQVVNELSL